MTTEETQKIKPGDILFFKNRILKFVELQGGYFLYGFDFVEQGVVGLNIMFYDTLDAKILKKHCQ